MKELLMNSLYFGVVISVGTCLFGVWLRRKAPLAILNPLSAPILLTTTFLLMFKVDCQDYSEGAGYLSYFPAPVTMCLAIPPYKQPELLKHRFTTVAGGIVSGVLVSAFSTFTLSKLFGLDHEYYVTLLPKSIITVTDTGANEEAGNIMMLTMASIAITGILGNIIAGVIFKLSKIEELVVRGLTPGAPTHVIGTTRALEIGETEGVTSGLAIAVAGLLTIVMVPLVSGLI